MPEILHRALGELHLRSDGDGRTVHGRIMPYGEVAVVNDGRGEYQERFLPGAFTRSIGQRADKVRLLVNHDSRQRLPIGKATALREERDGLYGEFHVSDTREGNEVLALVADGVVDSFSVGFRPIRDRRADDGVVERIEVALRETSLVTWGAYPGALVAGVRSESSQFLTVEAARFRLDLLSRKF